MDLESRGVDRRAVRVADGVQSRLAEGDWHVALVTRSAARLASGEALATIVDASAGGVPNGVLVAGLPDLRRSGLREGDPVGRSGDHLILGDAAVRVHLDRASPWSSRLSHGCLVPGRAVHRALAAVPAPHRSRRPGGTAAEAEALAGSALGRALDATLSALAGPDAVAARADAVAARAAAPLIGLGEGLTPSGDDVLVGLVAALWAGAHPAAVPFARACAGAARGTTTCVSADLLGHAAAGHFAERVSDVVTALAVGAASATADACAALLTMGATSGADTLLGLRAGVDLLLRVDRRAA